MRLAPAAFSDRTYYGVTALDANGRLGDRRVVRHLGWSYENRLEIREDHGLIVVTSDPGGVFRVSANGFVTLPTTVRRWFRLIAGDRVLLVADPDASWLVIHPPAAMAAMIAAVHQAAWAGEAQ